MSQRKPSPKKKRMPAYSPDTMILKLVCGLLLIALGVLILLSTVTNMNSVVFAGLSTVARGLAGSFAVLLPILPIWGGILIILSTQRKAPVRAFLLGTLLFMLLLAVVNLFSRTSFQGHQGFLLDIYQVRFASYPRILGETYATAAAGSPCAGLLGMVLGWPIFMLIGPVMGGIFYILLMIVTLLVMIRFDVRGNFAKLKARMAARREAAEAQQAQLNQQELQWQQQQAQQAAQAEAARRAQWQTQQQQQYAAQPYPRQGEAAPSYDYNAPLNQPGQQAAQPVTPGFQPTPEEMFGVPKRSLRERLFGDKKDRPESEDKPVRARRKRLFDEDAEDDWMSAEPARKPARQPMTARKPQETVTPSYPQPVQPEEAYPAAQPEDLYMPDEPDFDTSPVPVVTATPKPTSRRAARQTAAEAAPAPRKEPTPARAASSDWMRQLNEKMDAAGMNDPEVAPAPAPAPSARTASTSGTSGGTGSTRTRRSSAWDSEPATTRTSTWRDDPPAKPAVQKPKDSWSNDDRPPWEDPIDTPAAAVVPVVQPTTPGNTWKPDLDLAPVKNGAQTLGGMEEEEHFEIPYVYPELDLLNLPKPQEGISPEEDAIRSQRLEDTLASFKVAAKVRHVTHGPAISRFELELAAGIKVTKVTDLAQNIAMNMEVKSVRIEAPIPGKSLVGVEVPNRKTAAVTLREIMTSDPMLNAKSSLTVALGKDIAGTPIVCDLARMPHLLIAGATGSGKSVCINTMINSLLFRCSPKEVRMILVDPKVVELQCYNGIPHLLIPVVSDPHKAAGALAWAVAEMMDRYKKFQRKGVRAIDGYNAALDEGEEHMPRIVIIIDELADLMMTCKRDVEEHICRLAQLARAAGIHLVVATQRPSVDVITGLIKANIPSRIAFKVSSFIDSRTILDKQGAEQLLGYGDMLYQPTGEFTPIRIQGCFLSDTEVNSITDFIRENSPAQYDPNVIEELERLTSDEGSGAPDMSEVMDPTGSGDGSLLSQCIEMAVNDGQVSTSLIQRRLKVGYARAGRLVDEMEKRGIVSQKDGAKPRMCLLSREEYERMKESGELDG